MIVLTSTLMLLGPIAVQDDVDGVRTNMTPAISIASMAATVSWARAGIMFTARWGRAAIVPALLIMVGIVVGLASLSFGKSLGQVDTTAFDAQVINVQAMLDAYHDGEPGGLDADVRRVQAILDSRSADR